MSWQDNATPADSIPPASGGWQSRAIPVDTSGPTSVGGAVARKLWDILPMNPNNELKNLPMVGAVLGGGAGIPMGAMGGTAIGQGVRYAGDKLFNQPVPSPLQHGLELGGAALSDLTAFPAINKKIFGGQVGAVEKAAGVPPPQEIPSLPKPGAGQPVSGGIDETLKAVARAKEQGAGSPVFWKQIKDQIDSFYALGKDVKLTTMDNNKLAFLSKAVQSGLNDAVPGRAIPAAALARSQMVPNAIGNTVKAIPTWGKLALSGLGGDALLRVLSAVGGKGR